MNGSELIAEKARTNREHKGYTPEHDDTHDKGELVEAAIAYATVARTQQIIGDTELAKAVPDCWPFEMAAWKPSDDPIRNLVHAGALIAAEIDRLQRLAVRR
jgi:hypothetical protein